MGDAVKPLLCLVDEYVDQIKFQLNVIVFFFLSDRQIYLFFSNFDAVIEDFGQSEFIFVFFFQFSVRLFYFTGSSVVTCQLHTCAFNIVHCTTNDAAYVAFNVQ